MWYSLPHHVDLGDGRVSISRDLPRKHVTAYVAYEVKTTGDYWGDQQLAAYPAAADVVASPFGIVLRPGGVPRLRDVALRSAAPSCTRRRRTSG